MRRFSILFGLQIGSSTWSNGVVSSRLGCSVGAVEEEKSGGDLRTQSKVRTVGNRKTCMHLYGMRVCECVLIYIVYAVYVVGYWRSEREDCGNWLNLLDSGKAGCNGRRAYALAEMRILCCMYGGV